MPATRRFLKFYALLPGSLAVVAIAAVVACQSYLPQEEPDLPEEPAPTCESTQGHVERGKASYYGRRHHGRKTASGEKFDMNELTAAHRKLPLGTKIKVTNLENGKVVTLTVNDRGPYVRGRLLDVSERAAHELGFPDDGTTQVSIETIETC